MSTMCESNQDIQVLSYRQRASNVVHRGTGAPSTFFRHGKSWANTLGPGSTLAVVYQNAGSEEPAWWEAQP
ncbi:hypothetical protein PsorP6_013942 [Peronosclerospora sorghi]|uniref:Uncharacterized protein n=1 Tax=Peronosclerospora sorghi TaxID=230839 RepID=A0ACC0VGF6_9STRA|nr:hypothetical protein PsorP6_013942 [Peronosclerospora sorghi]